MAEKITWKEIKVRYPHFAMKFKEDFKKLFRELGRLNNPFLTVDDIENVIAEKGEGYEEGSYGVSLAPWSGVQKIRDDVTQMVVQINIAGEVENTLRQDAKVFEFFSKLSETSLGSGHPVVKDATVGWFRCDVLKDKSGREILFIDEIQSDVVQVAENFLNRNNDKYNRILDKLIEEGRYTEEEIRDICKKILELFKDWISEGMATLIRYAQKVGIKWVATHTRESKAWGAYVGSIYETVKKEYGFRDEVVDLEGVGSVKIGIRRANIIKRDEFEIANELVKIAEMLLDED